MQRVLFPNVGAEEGRRTPLGREEIECVGRLWSRIFPTNVETGILPELGGWDGLVPWLRTEESEMHAERHGIPHAGPPLAAVRTVHDKGFTARCVRTYGLGPPEVVEHVQVFDPDTLRSPAAADAIDRSLSAWPQTLRRRFTLKPRWGTSGRGRIAGRDRVDATLRSALPRLARRGGAILEPWFERRDDYSVQLWIASGASRVLGTTRQLLGRNGVYFGNHGIFDEGEMRAHDRDHEIERALRATALRLAGLAAERGYYGPAGVDAFTYVFDGDERLRPAVELNARFTTGHIALGLLGPVLRELGGEPGAASTARGWLFSLVPPAGGWKCGQGIDHAERFESATPAGRLDPGLMVGEPAAIVRVASGVSPAPAARPASPE